MAGALRLAVTAALLAATPALADNPMGYRLETRAEATALPRGDGTLGITVVPAGRVSDAGLSFVTLQVTQVRPGAAAAEAGVSVGARIVAVDGRVFPDLATFVAYVGAAKAGSRLVLDVIPAGGGPAQAERLDVIVGGK